MKNIVLTCYLTQRPDPQRNELWPDNRDATVKFWIESLRRCDLTAVIFHDGLSPAFIDKWSDEHVCFELVAWTGPGWSVLEERFRIYRDWLQDNECDWCLTTDLSDVEFYRDPFELMTDQNVLYIGSEQNRIGGTCIAEWMRRAYGGVAYPDRQILNPGILGGSRARLIYFCNRVLGDLRGVLRRTHPPVDVAVVNRIIYRERLAFVTGYPLHTYFRGNEGPSSGAAIRHK